MKKSTPCRHKPQGRSQPEGEAKDEEKQLERPKCAIGEIRMINGGPTTGGSFKSLKKQQQRQVNNIHAAPPLKHR